MFWARNVGEEAVAPPLELDEHLVASWQRPGGAKQLLEVTDRTGTELDLEGCRATRG